MSAYLTRWRIETAIRFVKQSNDLEAIRVLTYQRLRKMAVLVNAVAFFTAVVLGTRIKLEIHATTWSRLPNVCSASPTCRLYVLADGIREVWARSPRLRSPTLDDLSPADWVQGVLWGWRRNADGLAHRTGQCGCAGQKRLPAGVTL